MESERTTQRTPRQHWRDNSCSRNLKNYASDVTFNYFYSDSRKVLRIKADVLTPYDSWCTTFDFFVALSAPPLHRGGKPELQNFSYHRWSRYRSCGKRVTDSSQAVIISFLPTSFKSPHYLRPMRAYFALYATDVFITPCLSPCSVEEC